MLHERIRDVLGVRVSSNLEKYLGLLTLIGRSKKEAFVTFKERELKCAASFDRGKEVFSIVDYFVLGIRGYYE
ncbi:reverse transcriptase [Gossypium australe]|uniref:Reverse transcriptase n=1 Tax=Gossypium australe TaxID=47621 RepID=A0A5B6V1B4_9ROSI|nr:reverse transcriptase [Gossypium australe]